MTFPINDPYVLGSLGIMSIWISWLIYRYRRGMLFGYLLFVPFILLGLLLSISRFSSALILSAATIAFIVFALIDVAIDSKRIHVTRKALIVFFDSSVLVILICISVPGLAALVRGEESSVVILAFLLGAAASCLIMRMRKLVRHLRKHKTHQPFQYRLATFCVAIFLLSVLLVAQEEAGLFLGFVGAGVYWGGISLLPGQRKYRWHGNSDEIARQRVVGTAAILLGVAIMIFGIATVATNGSMVI